MPIQYPSKSAAKRGLGKKVLKQLSLLDEVPPVAAKKLARKQKKKAPDDYVEIYKAQMRLVAPELVPEHNDVYKRRQGAWEAEPGPVAEYYFHGTRDWRLDVAWPAARVAVEVDGGQWVRGGGRHGSDSDREKLNAAAQFGWRVLHYSRQQLERDPVGVAGEIRAALIFGVDIYHDM